VKPELERLAAVDWDFRDSLGDVATHGMHPYPAKFIGSIPRHLIRELAPRQGRVADIFCGSGTTLVEAAQLGHGAVGVDANPLACLISSAKTTPVSSDDVALLSGIATRAEKVARQIEREFTVFSSSAWRPSDDTLTFWFEPSVVEELAEVLDWCRQLDDGPLQRIALTAFSSIVVQVSRQDSDTRYVRRPKRLRPGDTMRRFAKAVSKARDGAEEFSKTCHGNADVQLVCADVLSEPDIGRVDLVVTSPPYPNAYSYHLYHRTRMVWLEMDQPTFKSVEIGSHRKYSSRSDRAATIETFRYEMASTFRWLAGHVVPAGYACFVVGNSTIRGERFDNGDVLERAAEDSGFTEVARFDRRMQATRKAFNPAIGKIKTEQLLVFERTG
jgi:site-specific DNA-methyltransferase (cytosine-N4-specific)